MGAIANEPAEPGPGKMRSADHHLFGDHPVEQSAPADLGGSAVLVIGAVPFGMAQAKRRNIGSIA